LFKSSSITQVRVVKSDANVLGDELAKWALKYKMESNFTNFQAFWKWVMHFN